MSRFDPFDIFGNFKPEPAFNCPESSFIPGIDDKFMIAWISHRDNSYTDTVFECAAANDVSIVGKWAAGEKMLCRDVLIFRHHQVRYYPVPPGFIEALEPSAEAAE